MSVFADDGCGGCAGQGGKACWYQGLLVNQDCNTVCAGRGGCVGANWNDSNTCQVCRRFYPGQPCFIFWPPAIPALQIHWFFGSQSCNYRETGRNQICGDDWPDDYLRFCVCRF